MKLRVLHNGIDYTLKMNDLGAVAEYFDITTYPLLIGSPKPLKNIYFSVTPRTEDAKIIVSAWNGVAFAEASGILDDTFGLCKPGYIHLPEEIFQVKSEISPVADNLFWVEVRATGIFESAFLPPAPVSVGVRGVGMVLSDDNDLGFLPNLSDYFPEGELSLIIFHQEATKTIVQSIRNSGKRIIGTNLNARQVEVFDLLNIEEFRNASKYLALNMLFDHLSKMDGDSWDVKAKRFYQRYLDNLNINLASIDEDDNGKTEPHESVAIQSIRIIRE